MLQNPDMYLSATFVPFKQNINQPDYVKYAIFKHCFFF